MISSLYKNDYNTRMIDLINKLRKNPKEYAKIILSNIQYLEKRVKIIADDITGQNEEKEEIFFKRKLRLNYIEVKLLLSKPRNFCRN